MALGAGQVTPLQMATGYSVFANGGYRVNPYLIADITDPRGAVVSHPQPLIAGDTAALAITPRNAYVMNSLLQSVAQRGTGARTNQLKRTDLAGKTGTTNDSHDAWFAGYQHSLVAIAWIGYDTPRSLGDKETGGGLALPVWMEYMSRALRGVPEYKSTMPPDVVSLGGELYFDDLTPGHGFVATIGVSQAMPDDVSGTSPAVPAPPVGEQEKQDIMNLFKGH
jgi:penicillin-binding protein 1A